MRSARDTLVKLILAVRFDRKLLPICDGLNVGQRAQQILMKKFVNVHDPVLLGIGVAEWQVPPELNAIYLQLEQIKREAEEKAAKEAAKKAGQAATNSVSATTSAPAGRKPNPPP